MKPHKTHFTAFLENYCFVKLYFPGKQKTFPKFPTCTFFEAVQNDEGLWTEFLTKNTK